MFCDAPEPPDTTHLAEANAELSRRMADMMEVQYEWSREVGERGLAMAEDMYGDITKPTSEFNFDNMLADRERYEKLYQPNEERYLAEVDKYLEPEYQEQLASRASSQVAQAFDAQRKNAEQRLTQLGVDPSQGRAIEDKTMQIAQAANQANSANSARQGAEQFGVSALGDTVNMGRGFAGQSVALGGQALQASQTGTSGFNAASSNAGNMAGNPTQWGSLALQGNNSAAGIYDAYGQSQQGAHSTPFLDILGGAAGTAAGAYFGKMANGGAVALADGGETPTALRPFETGADQTRQPVPGTAFAMDAGSGGVYNAAPQGAIPTPAGNILSAPDGGMTYGPGDGSGIDDRIPAAVSQGEYIIPADVVRKKGTDFFDKMLEQNHTPAAVQQAMNSSHGGALPVPQQVQMPQAPRAVAPMGQAQTAI